MRKHRLTSLLSRLTLFVILPAQLITSTAAAQTNTMLATASSRPLQTPSKAPQLSPDLPEPVIFGEGVICTGGYESHPAFSPSGDTLFFIRSAPDFSTWTLCVSYLQKGQWSRPEVAFFSGQYMDADPFFTKDGRTLYFVSNRPLKGNGPARDNMDIWKLEMTAAGWSQPIHLEAPFNSDQDEYYPTMADNGTFYFGSARPGGLGNCDIYRCRPENGVYSKAENLGAAINSADDEYEPFIDPDERYLLFMATRPNTSKGDLFVSYNRNGGWTPAERLPAPFNSERSEYAPKVTRDGKYFFFSSTRNKLKGGLPHAETTAELNRRLNGTGNGLGDIYQVNFSALHLQL